MAQTQSVKYSVQIPDGSGWSVRGETGDMAAALNAARGLLGNRQAPRVRVVQAFLDSASGRNVTTTIFDEKATHKSASARGGSATRWLTVAGIMFVVGFAAVFAVKTFFL
jgi:hypothetical protein